MPPSRMPSCLRTRTSSSPHRRLGRAAQVVVRQRHDRHLRGLRRRPRRARQTQPRNPDPGHPLGLERGSGAAHASRRPEPMRKAILIAAVFTTSCTTTDYFLADGNRAAGTVTLVCNYDIVTLCPEEPSPSRSKLLSRLAFDGDIRTPDPSEASGTFQGRVTPGPLCQHD